MPRSKATSTPDRAARSRDSKYRFIGGKGGVGKTTCAAAMGVVSARRGRRTLIISTDPAPSLADALRQPLGPTPRAIRGASGLDAVEVNAALALDRWLDGRRDTLETIGLRGTWLDREDVSRLLRLSLPGIDEIAGLLQIADFGSDPRYDQIIVDTAPTGHLLRMLGLPAVLQGLAQVFDHMQAKHRIMVDALRGGWTPDAADALIEEIGRQAQELSTLLRDAKRTRLSWVTLPEPMSVEETADGVDWLRQHHITVDQLIVNRLTPVPPGRCRWCTARRSFEHRAVNGLRRTQVVAGIQVIALPTIDAEPRGVTALAAFGRRFEDPTPLSTPRARAVPGVARALFVASATKPGGVVVRRDARLLMFGGKGGVGKTTCASAAALDAAAATPERTVLLLSVDPAHSVGDALGQRFSDVPRRMRGAPANLMVREIDAARVFRGVRDRFADAIEQLFRRVARSSGIGSNVAEHDRQVMRDLFELAPPGVDELVAIIEVTDSLIAPDDTATFDLVVMDTAPTGHALRLIEMPSLVHQWVKALMAILLKYQPVVGVGDLGAVLLRLSQGLGRLREVLSDPVRSQFIVVTRPGMLPRAETVRLLARLAAVRVSAPIVIVNAVGAGTCRRCQAERAAQRKEVTALSRDLRRAVSARPRVLLAPGEMPAPLGPQRLRTWRRTWRELAEQESRRAGERGS